MTNYTIIKKLGFGLKGTVFLIEYNGVKHALKIEHILETEINPNIKSPIWREINFCYEFGNKYPEYFIELKDYQIEYNCKHKQKINYHMLTKEKQDEMRKLSSSKLCINKIFSLVDTTLDKIILELNPDELKSIFKQIIHIVKLLHSNNYIHGDLRGPNIGVIKTKNKYLVKLIDFGSVLKKSDAIELNELDWYNKKLETELLQRGLF